MDGAFSWSTQYAAEPCLPSRASDDGLLGAFICTSFPDGALHPDHGSLDMSSSQPIPSLVHCHGGAGPCDSVSAAFMGLDTAADTFPSVTGAAVDGDLFDAFAEVLPEQATVSNSNTVFSGYSSITGGNISSGESNTCGGGGNGGQDMEVASPCAVSLSTQLQTPKTLPTSKRKRSTSITFGGQSFHHHHAQASATPTGIGDEPDAEAIAQAKVMIYRAAAMRPLHQLTRLAATDDPHQNKSRRRNVRISSDPQTVAARLRRERVSARLRALQRLVPGGSRLDTASMLDEAASYLRFLRAQLEALASAGNPSNGGDGGYLICNGGSLQPQQNYTGNIGVGGGTSGSGGGGALLAFGSKDCGINRGYVKFNRNMPL